MSEAAFSPRTILALVAVGIVSFSGLAVLSAYAPELRAASDGGAHALSSSAVGFKGAVVMLQALDAPVVVARSRPSFRASGRSLVVLTPATTTSAKDLAAARGKLTTLIVLPKWATAPEPLRPGFVEKIGVVGNTGQASALLKTYAPTTEVAHRKGVTRPVLRGAGGPTGRQTYLPLADIDRLQTISGEGWRPALVDEDGRMVLAYAKTNRLVLVLSDPDLLNTQGLAKLDNARAGMAIINAIRVEPDTAVIFDVTLNGYTRGRGIGRMMLEPPWLAATLCGVAAALLMGLHALARFGPARARGRAIALGQSALVDNSAGLVRMAGREAELAPAYAALTRSLIGRAAGGERADNPGWLADLARLRGVSPPDDLAAEADGAKTRGDLLAIARKLYRWRLEMTRERR